MFTWRYQACHTAALTCQNWAIFKNADPHTIGFSLARVCGITTPLTKQYFRQEKIGLNLTDIAWPENSKFLPSFEAFFAEFNSAYSSIFFRTIFGRCSLPVMQFSLMLLGFEHHQCSICALYLKYPFRLLLGLAELAQWIEFALRALLPVGTPCWRRYFWRSSTFHFCNSLSVKYIIKELKEYITTFKYCHIY